jgi:hypothetical protein
VSGSGMERFAREDVREVLARFGVVTARRVVDTDASEEVLLLRLDDFESIDPDELALAVMEVLPHMKVWVISEHPAWTAEEL